MSTRFPDLFRSLTRPFPQSEVKILRKAGRDFRYVTARTLMNRLDEVLGPENWSADYRNLERSIECRLTLTLPDGSSITKCDAGGCANMSDEGDDEKSGYSDAFKRVCMCWGISRELWGDGNVTYRVDSPASQVPLAPKIAPGHAALPAAESSEVVDSPPPRPTTRERGQSGNFNTDRLPTSGKSFYAWMKGLEERHTGENWCKALAFRVIGHCKKDHQAPEELKDWTPEHVQIGIDYVAELRSLTTEELRARENKAKRVTTAKSKGIRFDDQGIRIDPLTMKDKFNEADTLECSQALERVANQVGKTPTCVAKAIIDSLARLRAPYMDGMDADWDILLKCVTGLRIWWPDECRLAISEWKQEIAGATR